MDINLSVPSSKRIARFLLMTVLLLIGLSLFGQVSKHFFGHTRLKGFVPAFYVDYESSVPTWYSSATLGFAGVLLAVIAVADGHRQNGHWRHWAVLALLFFMLSIDEVAMFHEYPIEGLRRTFDAGGIFYYTWVVPGLLFVAVVGLSFSRFLWRLPRQSTYLFLLAGAIFVTGAIGVEMISGLHAELAGEETFTYAMIVSVEEFLEMAGVVVFIYALLEYIHRTFGKISLHLGPAAAV